MDKFGWVKVHSFNSSKTGNTVQVYVLDLTKIRSAKHNKKEEEQYAIICCRGHRRLYLYP